ncbi:MAG: hypothetical protein JW849_00940 [Phycisphaerae bacterium]|nr:hypothetical protein [Phycisphaerae bacterium]
MVIDDTQQTVRRINYTVLTFCLLLVAGGMTAVVFVLARAAASAEGEARPWLFRLAWAAATCLGIDALLLLWILLRWMRLRMIPSAPLPETPYIDAWSEAGKRIQVDEDDDEYAAENPADPWRE